MKTVLIIDGQGGKIGRALIERLCAVAADCSIVAVGTNSIATANMLKGGADRAATGENAIVVTARRADIIAGPVGIVMADAMLGEITARAAASVAAADAVRILLPMNRMACETVVVGVRELSLGALIDEAADEIVRALGVEVCDA